MAEEKQFENKVKKYLESIDAWYIKYWAGSGYTKSGIPDILACIDSRFYGIEVKATNGKPSVLQLVNLRKIRESGGVGVLLYPQDFKGFKDLVNGNTLGETWYRENIELQNEWYNKLNKFL